MRRHVVSHPHSLSTSVDPSLIARYICCIIVLFAVYVGGLLASRLTVISDALITMVTPPAQPYASDAAPVLRFHVTHSVSAHNAGRGTATVEIRATNDGLAWSNALHFTFLLDGITDGACVETCALEGYSLLNA